MTLMDQFGFAFTPETAVAVAMGGMDMRQAEFDRQVAEARAFPRKDLLELARACAKQLGWEVVK